MKVIIDQAIPYIKHTLEQYAEVEYLAATMITPAAISDADALIIRTRTKCNKELLEGSKVSFIATATIGLDHIDLDYCQQRGIKVCSAPGCNARGVLQWITAALHHITRINNRSPRDYTLGIVGVGNVGSLVSNYSRHWGFRVLECDPPRQMREGGEFYDIDEIIRECDIITLHTPLDNTTRHLINQTRIKDMRPEAIVINASRGGVVDNMAMAQSSHRYIFDVWENEPHIETEVLNKALLATPHIAGYSIQGKANATAMSIRALAAHFDLPLKTWYPNEVTPTTPRLISWKEVSTSIDSYFDIITESDTLRSAPDSFELLRNNYTFREEYF